MLHICMHACVIITMLHTYVYGNIIVKCTVNEQWLYTLPFIGVHNYVLPITDFYILKTRYLKQEMMQDLIFFVFQQQKNTAIKKCYWQW